MGRQRPEVLGMWRTRVGSMPGLWRLYTTWADIGSGTGPIIALPLVTTAGFGWTYGSAAIVIFVAVVMYWAVFARR